MISQIEYNELILYTKKLVSSSKNKGIDPIDLVHDVIVSISEADIKKIKSLIYTNYKAGLHLIVRDLDLNRKRYAEIKICKRCKEEKLNNDFYLKPDRKFNYYDSICKKCRIKVDSTAYKEYREEWLKRHIETLSDTYVSRLIKTNIRRTGSIKKEITTDDLEKKRQEVIIKRQISLLIKKGEWINDAQVIKLLTDIRKRNRVNREDVTPEMIERKRQQIIERRKNKRSL